MIPNTSGSTTGLFIPKRNIFRVSNIPRSRRARLAPHDTRKLLGDGLAVRVWHRCLPIIASLISPFGQPAAGWLPSALSPSSSAVCPARQRLPASLKLRGTGRRTRADCTDGGAKSLEGHRHRMPGNFFAMAWRCFGHSRVSF